MALVFVAWTLLVWGTRIDNVLGDTDLGAAGRAGRLALAGSFVALAVVAAVGLWRSRRAPTGWLAPVLRLLALWTVGVWLVRVVQIAVGGHEAAFVAVHIALAVVSVALAVATWRNVRRPVAATVT